MTRRTDAYTLVETLVSVAVGLACLAIMITLFTATRRMTNVGDLSSALSQASIAMEILHRDLSQAVQKPVPTVDRIVFPLKTNDGFRFIRGERRDDGTLTGKLVSYQRERTSAGNFRLVRRIDAQEDRLPGTFSAIKVGTFKATGGPFLRVTLHVVARDVTSSSPAQGSDEAVLTTLVRVAGPEMIQSGLLEFKFMEALKSIDIPD